MPRLSVIVPAHNVHGYLRQCVDSVVQQSSGDVEVIIVDDCSTDATRELALELAQTHPGVTAVRPEENLGLGEARNYGLDRATGDYVIFLDGDDYLAPGAVSAITARLEEHPVDVLLFQYARAYPDGAKRPGVILEPLMGDEPFTLVQRPEILEVLNVAWNKASRREFLLAHDLRFPVGYYEDIPWTYPALALAESIIGLVDVCYMYRQRWSGSILRSTDARHLEILDQFTRLMDRMDAEPDLDPGVRDLVFEAGFVNLINLATGASHRLPKGAVARYYREARALVRARAREGYTVPREGRLAEFGPAMWSMDYRRFSALLGWTRTSRRIQRRWNRITNKFTRLTSAPSFRFYGIYRRLLRVDRSLVVHESLWGLSPRLNPLAVQREIERRYPELKHRWMIKPSQEELMPEGQDYAVIGSHKYLRTLAQGGYFFLDMNLPTEWIKRPGQVVTQLHHGTPIKLMGVEETGKTARWRRGLIRRSSAWDYSLVSSDYCAEVWAGSYPVKAETIAYGYPRNDVLVNATPEDVSAARERLGLPDGRRVLLYMPTFREGKLSREQVGEHVRLLGESLDADDLLLVRGHYFGGEIADGVGDVRDVSAYEPVADLYLAADLLITDYSSAMFDYANLGRPIVVFAYDVEEYRWTRGVYFNVTADAPGAVVETIDDLVNVLRSGEYASPQNMERLAAYQATFCQYEDGHAAERVVRRVIGREEIEPVPSVHGAPRPLSTWTTERVS